MRKKAKKKLKSFKISPIKAKKKTGIKKTTKSQKKRVVLMTRVLCSKKTKNDEIFHFGNVKDDKKRILIPFLALNFFLTIGIIFSMFHQDEKPVSPVVIVKKNSQMEKQIRAMVKGYPIENMVPFIAARDKQTAAFLVAIAKKESAWGKHKPVLDGEDCYNYWGFRMETERMGSGGHTCFDSPKQAVNAVADRIDELVKEEKINSPNKMIVWKCGYDCLSKSKSESEIKWIKDVGYYYQELIN